MRTIAILPIKSFGAAKQRLSGALEGGSRGSLARAMFSDVLATLEAVPAIHEVAVVTAEPLAAAAARERGATVVHDGAESGQSAAAVLGIRHVMDAGAERVLLVPGDTPLLDAHELAGMLERAESDQTAVTIVPDRHGEGTNALLLSPPGAIAPSFGPGSLARHLAAAGEAGAAHRVEELPGLTLDIDTPGDLAALRARLAGAGGRAPATRAALAKLGGAASGPSPVRVRS